MTSVGEGFQNKKFILKYHSKSTQVMNLILSEAHPDSPF